MPILPSLPEVFQVEAVSDMEKLGIKIWNFSMKRVISLGHSTLNMYQKSGTKTFPYDRTTERKKKKIKKRYNKSQTNQLFYA